MVWVDINAIRIVTYIAGDYWIQVNNIQQFY